MQIRNDYERQVFNGDMGRITGIDLEEGMVNIEFDGRIVQAEFLAIGRAGACLRGEYPQVARV